MLVETPEKASTADPTPAAARANGRADPARESAPEPSSEPTPDGPNVKAEAATNQAGASPREPASGPASKPAKEDVLGLINKTYDRINAQVSGLTEEAENELGRWVNILSYVADNVVDGTNTCKANDLAKRAELAVSATLAKPQPALALAREVRHEIVMDIYRTDDWLSRLVTAVTNGSPSVTVAFGVFFSMLSFIGFLLLMAYISPVDIQSIFKVGPDLIACGAASAFAGAMVSVLIRLDQFEARRGVDPKLLFLNAVFKPYIGAIISLFVVAVQGLGIISIPGVDLNLPTTGSNVAFWLIVVGFLSGFSERFASDLIGGAEGRFGIGRPGGRPGADGRPEPQRGGKQ